MRKFIVLISISLFLFTNSDCFGQWIQTNGPYGNGIVRSFAVLGTDIYGGSYELGVFRSTNNGDSWYQTSLNNKAVNSLYGNGSALYCAATDGGYKTTDNGITWTKIVDISTNAFFSFNGKLFVGTYLGVYTSTNGGENWTSSGLEGKSVNVFIANGTNIFAGIYNGYNTNAGVYLSTDFGTSWTLVTLANISIKSFASSGNNVFALSHSGVIYQTSDNGSSWISHINPSYTAEFSSMAMSGTNLYAGTVALYGVYGRLLKSTDYGSNWTILNAGAPGDQSPIALLTNGNDIFAGYEHVSQTDIYRSTDNGASWTINNTGILFKLSLNIASVGSTVYTGTYCGGVYATTNNGDSWYSTNNGLPDLAVWSLTSTTSGGVLLAGVGDSGLYRSSNGGGNWIKSGISNHQIEHIVVSGNNVYIGGYSTYNQGGVYMSTDNGLNWTSMGMDWETISALGVCGNYVFAAKNNNGLYRTSINGTTWVPVNNGLTNQSISSVVSIGTNVFVGTSGNGVFLSTNYGDSWTEVNSGLPFNGNVYIYNLIPYGSYLFAGILGNLSSGNTNTLFMSTNNGATWLNKSQGFDTSIICIYDICVANNYVFAATRISCGQGDYGKSVWRRSYSETIGINKISSTVPNDFKLYQNYPNPFNPVTTIKFDISNSSFVTLEIFDIAGRKIASLVNEKLNLGGYSVSWDASKYPSGIYFYRLKTDNHMDIKKMMLVK